MMTTQLHLSLLHSHEEHDMDASDVQSEYDVESRTVPRQDSTDNAVNGMPSSQFKILLWVTLPILLWIQFAMAFSSGVVDYRLSWSSIQCCIGLYVVAGVVYRQSLSSYLNAHGESSLTLLVCVWPEITADIALFLVLFNMVEAAAMFLIFATFSLVVNAILFEFESRRNIIDKDDEEHSLTKDVSDYEILVY